MMGKWVDRYALETEARKQWAADPAVRKEFGSVESYIGWRIAEARGAGKSHGGFGVSSYSPVEREPSPGRSTPAQPAARPGPAAVRAVAAADAARHEAVREVVQGAAPLSGLVASIQNAEDRALVNAWASSPALRDEFGTFEAFKSYRQAMARGAVRIL